MGELFDAQAAALTAEGAESDTVREAETPRGAAPAGEPDAAQAREATSGGGPPAVDGTLGDDVRKIVAEGIEYVRKLVEERYALDRFREGQVDKLHAELQGYKSDLIAKAVRPVLQSLIRLHDDLGKVVCALRQEDPSALTHERLLKLLGGFREDVEMALDHNGVSTFGTGAEEFDPRRQKVVRTVETSEQALVGRLAARVRPGFEQGETILEKERVAVYVLSSPVASDGEEVSA